jgi:hypothetical protein
VRRRKPEVWKKRSWVLHQDNVLVHKADSQDVFDEAKDHCVGTSTVLT